MELRKVIESLSHRAIVSKESPAQDPETLRHNDTRTPWIILLVANGLGAGFSPFAPGTAGTIVAIPIYYFLSFIPFPLYELTILTFFFLSCWVSDKAQTYWKRKDDRRIVI